MRNAEEREKLLEQITELERNSINYFDVEKEFFLITSDNLHSVRPKLYGYSIQRDGIYEDDNLTPEAIASLDGRGCYVYVDVRDGQITIKQDINGCWGLYLFRHGDYFALSNSFFRLLDYVKFRYPLTVNRDYCHQVLTHKLCSQAYLETAANEIRNVERNAIIHIDIAKKNLEIELINYKEHTVPLDSEEGITILDRWVEFWSGVLRGIAQHTNFISADLTGGFDSRMSFVFVLNSGIDLNKIQIRSNNGSHPIYVEDYDIASSIGEHYGFKLNQPLPARQFLNYSLKDTWNADLYSQQTFCNSPSLSSSLKGSNKHYCVTGYAGEILRNRWHMSPQSFMHKECDPIKRYSPSLARLVIDSIHAVINFVFHNIRDKYRIEDPNFIDIPHYLYLETLSRTHFGKSTLASYLRNVVNIIPAYDPEMQTVQLKTLKCPDYNLLMTLLFTRYAPDLLKIRFDKFHAPLDFENLIPCAQEINERFPLRPKNEDNMKRGGGYFICSRVICKWKKSSLRGITTQPFQVDYQKLA